MDFGSKLKALRTGAGITQAALAQRLGVTKSVVSYYERMERVPSTDVIVNLAHIFHVSTDYLLDVSGSSMIDISGLSSDDIQLLVTTADALRRKRA